MRYPYLIALAMLMAMPPVSTLADEPTADQRLRAGPSPRNQARKKPNCTKPSGVFAESGLIRFRLLSGRIEIDPSRYRKGAQEIDQESYRESITVSASRGVPSVYYTYKDDYQTIQLVAEYGRSLKIESTLAATGEQGTLEQTCDGKISWTVRRDPEKESLLDVQCEGPTLLHIVGQDESGFQIHMESLVSRMLLGRSVIELTRRTEQFLQRNTNRLSIVTADRVDALIEQLRSPSSATRRRAAKALAKYGTSITPFLTSALRRHDLDVEQVARIQSLIRRNPRIDEDTASSLAYLLSGDRAHWQIMARKMDQTEWIAANDHVRRCGLAELTR